MAVSEERYEVDEEFDMHDLDGQLEDEDDAFSTTTQIESVPIWQIIRRFFFKTPREQEEENRTRVYILNQAIETYPKAAVNYLLRGELYLKLRQRDLAQEDFNKALELAQKQFDNDRWGLGSQAIQDRARRGLQRTVR